MQSSRGKDEDTSLIMYHEKVNQHHLQYDEEDNSISNTSAECINIMVTTK